MAELRQPLGPRQRRDRSIERRRQYLSTAEIANVMHPALGLFQLVHPPAHRALCLQSIVHVRSVHQCVSLRLAADVDVAESI
jgi:hypothetical protein